MHLFCIHLTLALCVAAWRLLPSCRARRVVEGKKRTEPNPGIPSIQKLHVYKSACCSIPPETHGFKHATSLQHWVSPCLDIATPKSVLTSARVQCLVQERSLIEEACRGMHAAENCPVCAQEALSTAGKYLKRREYSPHEDSVLQAWAHRVQTTLHWAPSGNKAWHLAASHGLLQRSWKSMRERYMHELHGAQPLEPPAGDGSLLASTIRKRRVVLRTFDTPAEYDCRATGAKKGGARRQAIPSLERRACFVQWFGLEKRYAEPAHFFTVEARYDCPVCGKPSSVSTSQFQAAHIIPAVLGGPNQAWNLIPSCACNQEYQCCLLDYVGTHVDPALRANVRTLAQRLYRLYGKGEACEDIRAFLKAKYRVQHLVAYQHLLLA